jgi:formylglycine-generating enzyme required for sulfatase activity
MKMKSLIPYLLGLILILMAVALSISTNQALALPDEEIQAMARESDLFREAEERIVSIWKDLPGDFKASYRNEQREWIKTLRDQEAEALMTQGCAKDEAYAAVTDARSDYLLFRVQNPSESYSNPVQPQQVCSNFNQAPKTLTNSLGMEFILIEAGSFQMGSDGSDENGYKDETPQHMVAISKPFYLGKFEVTQSQWEAVMGENPSEFKGNDNPVEKVSWDDAQAFISKLNEKEGTTAYRLPTEAEWEYAARAGTSTAYSFGDDPKELADYAWYGDNSRGATRPVGTKKPNPWGLYDVYGNVYEWVGDRYGGYAASSATDPKGSLMGSSRVIRGGSWDSDVGHCQSTRRGHNEQPFEYNTLGFRLALAVEK